MFSKKSTERPRRKVGRGSTMATESPETIFDDALDAVQRLRLRGRIDQESADALTKFLLAGYLSYTILQEADDLTEYILEAFSQAETNKNG